MTVNSRAFFLPANHTSELQPLDVSINHLYKQAFRDLYDDNMLSSVPEFTNAGNRKKMSY